MKHVFLCLLLCVCGCAYHGDNRADRPVENPLKLKYVEVVPIGSNMGVTYDGQPAIRLGNGLYMEL